MFLSLIMIRNVNLLARISDAANLRQYKLAVISVFVFLFFCSPLYAEVTSSLWQTDKSQHFIINYQYAPSGYIPELIERAEKYYNSIIDELGYRRFDFWSWDKRAKVYLYKDSSEYLNDTNRTGWSGASVSVKDRVIRTFIGQGNFFDSILPHEMAHIIFREFIGVKVELPLWIEEGVACSQETTSLKERLRIIKELISRSAYIGVNQLSVMKDYTSIDPKVFYSESASLIFFLLRKYGADRFLDFSRQIRDGVNWQEALIKSYRFENLNEFENKWKEYFLGQKS